MNKITIKLLVAMVINVLFAHELSADSNIFDRPFYKVTSDSRTQILIDNAVGTIFKSDLKDGLCRVFQNALMLSYTMGITIGKAISIYSNCLGCRKTAKN